MDDETRVWVQEYMPVLIEFAVTPTDDWLREAIRGTTGVTPPPLQRVIVQGTREADRIVNRLANTKTSRRLPYGGALRRRANKGDDY